MDRENRQARVLQAAEEPQDVLRVAAAAGPALVPVGQGRLVAVVAVCNQRPLGAQAVREKSHALGVVHPDDPAQRPVIVTRFREQIGAQSAPHQPRDLSPRIRVQEENSAQVGPGGRQESLPVGAGTVERPLVRNHRARGERLERQPREETAPGGFPAGRIPVALLAGIKRGACVAHQQPIVYPALEQACGGLVGVLALRRARQVEMHHVVRVAIAQAPALVFREHIVRRRHETVHPVPEVRGVTQGPER